MPFYFRLSKHQCRLLTYNQITYRHRCIVQQGLTGVLYSNGWLVYCTAMVDRCIVQQGLTGVLYNKGWPVYCTAMVDQCIVQQGLTGVLYSNGWLVYCTTRVDQCIVQQWLTGVLYSKGWSENCYNSLLNVNIVRVVLHSTLNMFHGVAYS